MAQTVLSTNQLYYEINNNSILENVSQSVLAKERIGIIGTNGSGKTTLLKILAGIFIPSKGSITLHANSFYLPQLDMEIFTKNIPLYAYLNENVEEWWKVFEILNSEFHINYIEEDRILSSLSGGELMKIHLALAKALNPEILLLDEPTNHLDLSAQEELVYFLRTFSGALLIVSHNSFFLNQTVSKVWEIKDCKVNVWGGTYSEYLIQKENLQMAQGRKFEVARKEGIKIKKSLAREATRSARSKRNGRIASNEKSVDRYSTSFFGNRASRSAGNNKKKLETLLENKKQSIEKLKPYHDQKVIFNLVNTRDSHVTLLSIKNAKLYRKKNILLDSVSIDISYGDRMILVGNNGSGKSSLLKALMQKESYIFDKDLYKAKNLKMQYMSQSYENVDSQKSLIENIIASNETLSYEEARRQLGNFLFNDESEITKKASYLSGGEVARLSYAMITANPLDILLLDEPTNNLDAKTTDIVTVALNSFAGSIFVVSHDVNFLHQLTCQCLYGITKKEVKKYPLNVVSIEDIYNAIRRGYEIE